MSHSSDNILVIESVENRADIIKSTLMREGITVSAVNSGTEAKDKINFTSYSLILLSNELPDIPDSAEFLSYIKQLYPETIVILMFNHFSQEMAIKAGRRGAYDFFNHNSPIEDLRLIVEKSLERRRLGLNNKQLFVELQKKNLELEWMVKELSVLYEISKTIASQPTLEDALKGLFSSVQQVISIDYFLCLSFDQENQAFSLRFARGIDKDVINKLSLTEIKIGYIPTNNMSKEDMASGYTKSIAAFFEKQGLYKLLLESFLAVPIFVDKCLYGLFIIASNQKNNFTEEHRKLLSIIASQALSLYEKASRITKSTQLITMGQMISEIAHDLRHPITSIKGSLQNLENKWYDDNFRKKSLKVVNSNLFRLNELIKELLEFSNPDRFPLKMVDINQTLQKVLLLVQSDLLKHKINLVQEISAVPPIQVNEERIKEVFLNLIINAIDAMDSGGILKISSQLKEVRENGNKRYIQIIFKDSGVGIKQANLKRIFDHFFSTKSSGMGLGLAIVNRIIKTHNGFIRVESEESKGASFIIFLPVNSEC